MKIPARASRSETTFNMTPMIDIVFLLIIFFLVAGHLARREARVELDLPVATAGSFDEPQPATLTISIMANGKTQWADRELGKVQLENTFREHFARFGHEAEVRIRGDRKAPYRYLSEVLKTAADAGLAKVSVATLREPLR